MRKKSVFDFVYPISILGFGNGICKHLLALSKIFRKSRKLSTTELFWRYSLFLGGYNATVFNSQNWNNLIAQDFVGAFANMYYSMLALGDFKNVLVKSTIYISFVQKLLWYFFIKNGTKWEIAF